jgi:hypothetical protein
MANFTLLHTNVTVYTAPPELVSHEAALAIAAALFMGFMLVGVVAIVGCYLCACACERPVAPDTTGCREMMLCRMCSFCGFWCYVKCCRRSKLYVDRVMDRGRKMMDGMEMDLENQLMEELVEIDPSADEAESSEMKDILEFEVLDGTAALKPSGKTD